MTWLWSMFVLLPWIGAEGPPIGSTVRPFDRPDARGVSHRVGVEAGSGLVVLAFLKIDCPVTELSAAELGRLASEYKPRGVAFFGISADEPADLDRFAAGHGLTFPILRDSGELASLVGATRTPDVVVLDDRRSLRYRGRIDDRHAVGSSKPSASTHDLARALDELLGGRTVTRPETPSVGCRINLPDVSSEVGSAPVPVTYARDIAPILQRRCVECHRPGQIGPFSLLTYRQVSAWVGPIAEAVEAERMPPWHASPDHGRFANDPRLTADEKARIATWVDGGAPEGDPADLPPPRTFTEGWRIDSPDVVVTMPRGFEVPAQGVVDYQYFEVDPGFRQDTWVRQAELRPGNRRVVHHVNVFLKDPSLANEADSPGELGSYCLAAMTPGTPPLVLPDGMAKKIPAGWHLLFVVHYAPTGTPQSDQTSLGLVLADPASVTKEVATNLLFDPDLHIPPGDADYRVERSRKFDEDVLLIAMFPHMHLRGRSFRYEAEFPGGTRETLLDVPRYDFRWQNRYELAEPRRLPAGTILHCLARFDNSAGNPDNPNPQVEVRTGKQSWEEMFNGYYEVTLADEDRTRPPSPSRVVKRLLRKHAPSPLQLLGLSGLGPAWLLWRRMRRRDRVNPV